MSLICIGFNILDPPFIIYLSTRLTRASSTKNNNKKNITPQFIVVHNGFIARVTILDECSAVLMYYE